MVCQRGREAAPGWLSGPVAAPACAGDRVVAQFHGRAINGWFPGVVTAPEIVACEGNLNVDKLSLAAFPGFAGLDGDAVTTMLELLVGFEGLEDLAKGVLADRHEPDLVHLSGGEHPRGGQHVSDVWGVERTPQDGNSHFFPFPTALPQATTTIVEDEGRAPKTRE